MKKAFTTAELLISLVIVGTIALLVVPTFVKDYNMKVYSATIKDTYSNIMAAVARICADRNVTYLEHIGFSTNTLNNVNEQNFLRNYMKGKIIPSSKQSSVLASSYKSLDGTSINMPSNISSTIYKLQNGVVIIMECGQTVQDLNNANHTVCTFNIDINGRSAPNTGGIDIFRMDVDVATNSIVTKADGTCVTSPIGDNCIPELLNNDWDMEGYTVIDDGD